MCRSQLTFFADHMRWKDAYPSWINLARLTICPNHEARRAERTKHMWFNPEESGKCMGQRCRHRGRVCHVYYLGPRGTGLGPI